MGERWVINASPVILLAKAEVIQFLPGLCNEFVIPSGVVGEVAFAAQSDAGRKWLAAEGGKFIKQASPNHAALATWNGGNGEAEVISWALRNSGFTAILDDRRARNFAIRLGVPVLGSLRVIVLAKERGFISKAAIPRKAPGCRSVSDRRVD